MKQIFTRISKWTLKGGWKSFFRLKMTFWKPKRRIWILWSDPESSRKLDPETLFSNMKVTLPNILPSHSHFQGGEMPESKF